LFGAISIILYVVIIEMIALWLNRSIINNADMHANSYMFTVRYTKFSIFFSIIISISLAAFVYYFFTTTGVIDSRIITAIIIFIIELIELFRKIFFKVEVDGQAIKLRSIRRRTDFYFSDIHKIETARVFGMIFVDIFINDKKLLTLTSQTIGHRHLLERLRQANHIEEITF